MILISSFLYLYMNCYVKKRGTYFMPRTKGSKNCSKIELNAQSAKLQKDKVLLEEGIAKTVAQTEK